MNADHRDNPDDELPGSIERRGLVVQVIAILRKDIASGRYAVGQRLPSELDLSKQLMVGRSTIREAIKSLNVAGMVVTLNGRGTFVAPHDPFQPQPGDFQPAECVPELIEIAEFRCMIEVEAAYWTSQRAGSEHLREIRSNWKAVQKAIHEATTSAKSDIAELVRLDVAFHASIVIASRNLLILGAYQSARARIEWATNIIFTTSPVVRARLSHELLVEGLEQRNPMAAVRAVRQNHEELNRYVRTLIAQHP